MLTLIYICSGSADLETPWKSKNQTKTEIVCHTCGKRESLLYPQIANLSNKELNTCSRNMFSQSHKSQDRILLKRRFTESGIGTPTLCPTKLGERVGGKPDLSWDKTFSVELLLSCTRTSLVRSLLF